MSKAEGQGPAHRSNLFAALSSTYVSSAISTLTPALAVPFLLRWLGEAGWGVVAIALTIQAASLALEAGLSQANITRLSNHWSSERTLDQGYITYYTKVYLTLAAALTLPGFLYIFYALSRNGLSASQCVLIGLLTAIATASTLLGSLFRTALIAAERFGQVGALTSVAQMARYGLAAAAAYLTKNPAAVVFVFSAVSVLETAGRFWLTRRISSRSLRSDGHSARTGIKLSGVVLVGSVTLNFDKLLVGMLLPLASTGRYQVLLTVAAVSQAALTPFAQVLLPKMVRKDAYKGDFANKLTKRYLATCAVVWTTSISVVFLLGNLVTRYLHISKPEAHDWHVPLFLLITGGCLNAAGEIYYARWLRDHAYRLIAARNAITATFACAVLYFLIKDLQLIGAATLVFVNGLTVLFLGYFRERRSKV